MSRRSGRHRKGKPDFALGVAVAGLALWRGIDMLPSGEGLGLLAFGLVLAGVLGICARMYLEERGLRGAQRRASTKTSTGARTTVGALLLGSEDDATELEALAYDAAANADERSWRLRVADATSMPWAWVWAMAQRAARPLAEAWQRRIG